MNALARGLWYQALGDATGRRFEFLLDPRPEEVLREYKGRLNITDDTQMTLFALEACINSLKDAAKPLCEHLSDSFYRWYETQAGEYQKTGNPSMLQMSEKMWRRVAPGNTCMAGARTRTGVPNGRGCGGIMRMLPMMYLPGDRTENALANSRATHLSDHADEAAIRYVSVFEAVEKSDKQQVLALVQAIAEVDAEQISDLGGGWRAVEALTMGAWAYAKALTYDELLTLSICHAGDSDSVAAIAGAFWGTDPQNEDPEPEAIARLEERGVVEFMVRQWEKSPR